MSPRCSFGAIAVVKIIAVSQANCPSLLSTNTSTLCGLPRLLTLNRSVTVWWWNTTGKCGNGIDNRQTLLTTAPLHNTHMGRGLFIRGQPYPSEGGSPALPNFGGSLICLRTPFVVELPNFTRLEEGLFLMGQPWSRPKRKELQRSPMLWVFHLWLKNDQTGRGKTCGRGSFLGGQPRPASQGGVAL